MMIFNVVYSDNYGKKLRSVFQYHIDDQIDHITNFESLKFKARITGRIPAPGNTRC